MHDVMRSAADNPCESATSRRSCVELAVTVRDYPSARACASAALIDGADSTWHLIRLAWLDVHRGERGRGEALLVEAIGAAGSSDARTELLSHADAGLDLQGVHGTKERDARLSSLRASLRRPQRTLSDSGPDELVELITPWLSQSEFWGGAFYGCPYQIGGRGLTVSSCDHAALPPERAKTPRAAPLRVALAEFWDPVSREPRVALSWEPVAGSESLTARLVRLWSVGEAGVGTLTERALIGGNPPGDQTSRSIEAPHGIRAWFIEGSPPSSPQGWFAGSDIADRGRERTACLSDLFLMAGRDPDEEIGPGWIRGARPSLRVSRATPGTLGVQVHPDSLPADGFVDARIVVSSLEAKGAGVEFALEQAAVGPTGELAMGFDLSRLDEGWYRVSVFLTGLACGAGHYSSRDFVLAR
ncbi:MAG TPA: hypothetical protein PLI93_13715 [Gemmatimonadales bacterium]|nr:hypothetical protein [Gemmatimonadales bacterium]MCB9518306.1 hypothetical protein [Gemmatimonadales bacterium]HPF63105.1 hypothetical protein [Gemmatimonadales bacterium]HRX18180.1 hypothetical protein [Gemmatimonadales bacterium]